jgi:hypothetical protein
MSPKNVKEVILKNGTEPESLNTISEFAAFSAKTPVYTSTAVLGGEAPLGRMTT